MDPPAHYIDYFASDRPKEGPLSVDPGWFQLWSPAELQQMNQRYSVPEFAPGFLGFGSSGGGELLAFDSEGRIVMIPFVPMSPDQALPVAGSWDEFVQKIGP